MEFSKHSKQAFQEYLYVTIILAAIYLPARILFANYVAGHWLGSFGLLTVISILLIYFAKKGKMGKFGRIFLKRIYTIQTGKKKYLIYGKMVFWIIVWSLVTAGLSHATERQNEINQIQQVMDSPEGQARQEQVRKNLTPEMVLKTIVGFMLLPFVDFEAYSILVSLVDRQMNSFLSHFSIIFLVESCEGLAILIYFRIKTADIARLDQDRKQ